MASVILFIRPGKSAVPPSQDQKQATGLCAIAQNILRLAQDIVRLAQDILRLA
jgi:hypothetical protein